VDEVAEAMEAALRMPLAERVERWRAMMAVLEANDVHSWRRSFLKALADLPL
jgi:trehalose 6-phosphate synthase